MLDSTAHTMNNIFDIKSEASKSSSAMHTTQCNPNGYVYKILFCFVRGLMSPRTRLQGETQKYTNILCLTWKNLFPYTQSVIQQIFGNEAASRTTTHT